MADHSWSWPNNPPDHVIASTFPGAHPMGQDEGGKDLRYRKKSCNDHPQNHDVKHTSSFYHLISILKAVSSLGNSHKYMASDLILSLTSPVITSAECAF